MRARRNRRLKRTKSGINIFNTALKNKYFREDGLNYRRRRKKLKFSDWQGAMVLMLQIVATVAVAFFLVSSFGICINVTGDSMESVISDGDNVLINKLSVKLFSPGSGDVIAFSPQGNKDAALSVKRIIGVPGDRIRIENGAVYVNDKQYNEIKATDYIYYAGLAESEISLDKDEYFVLGDNVSNSQDSRYESVGNVKKSDIKGQVWWNLSHFGLIY